MIASSVIQSFASVVVFLLLETTLSDDISLSDWHSSASVVCYDGVFVVRRRETR